MGDIANGCFQYDLASDYLDEALLLVQKVDNPDDLMTVKHELARTAFFRKEDSQSIRIATEVASQAEELKDLNIALKIHKLLSEAYHEISRNDLAYHHAKIHNQLSDSLYNDEILAVTNELGARYENDQKVAEIELQAIQLTQRETERNFLMALVATILVIVLLILNQYRIKNKANTKLQELDRLKSDFFANISHEFHTPLSLIMAPLKKRIEQSQDDKDWGDFNMMYRNADRLLTLIDQLLDLSKLESQSIKLEKSKVEVNHFFRIIIASFSSFADHKNIKFTATYLVDLLTWNLTRM